ncbi:MAG: GxxExxY protein [Nitrospinae bacterium]|nr:GxxExxY protein [Nitrospinota bacterium]
MNTGNGPQRHRDTEGTDYFDSEITERIIACAIEVHRQLGPGLMEATYEECLCHEFALHKMTFERQKNLPLEYKGKQLECAYRMDIVVETRVVLEIKGVEKLTPLHTAQLLTYLRLSKIKTGLLINFIAAALKDGIKRLVL